MFDMNLDYTNIIAGTSDTYSKAYKEAAANTNVETDKGVKILTNFLKSIESLNSKENVKDTRISSSKGNIKSFSGYEDINTTINFLNKNFKGAPDVKECIKIFNALEKYTSQYTQAYEKKNRLIVLEYENALYLLVTGLSSIVANRMDVVTDGEEIKIQSKGVNRASAIEKALSEMAKTLDSASHDDYLNTLLDAKAEAVAVKESVYTEVTAADVAGYIGNTVGMVKNVFSKGGTLAKKGINIFKAARGTFFGIVPLIRSVLYLRYKKKADTILALEQQALFIRNNIEKLENIKNMDPKKKAVVIKKQQAVAERYMKKAAKLRAQLMETEKEASTAQAAEDKKIGNTDDDFVLENGMSVKECFE